MDLRDNPAYIVRPEVSSCNRVVDVDPNYEIVQSTPSNLATSGHVTTASGHVTGHVGVSSNRIAADIAQHYEVQEPITQDYGIPVSSGGGASKDDYSHLQYK